MNGGQAKESKAREYTRRKGREKETTREREERHGENGPAVEKEEENCNKIGGRTGGETR